MRLKSSKLLCRFTRCQKGATAIEYGILAALAALAIIAGVNSLSSQINRTFSTIASQVSNA